MTRFGARVRTGALATAAVVALLGAAGCTGEQVAKDKDAPKTHGRVMKFALGAEGSSPVRVSVPDKPKATAKASAEGMEFELYVLKRSGKVVTVVFAMHNAGKQDVDSETAVKDLDESPGQVRYYASNVSLVDTAGLKEYRSFLTDDHTDEENCLCSLVYDGANTNDFSPGERQYFVVEVAAPPANVKQVTVLAHVASIPDQQIDG